MLTDVLATARITDLVVEDKITKPIRDSVTRRWPESKVAYLVTCKKCVSVWAGLAVVSGLIPRRVLSALALSEITILLDRQDERAGEVAAAKIRKLRGR